MAGIAGAPASAQQNQPPVTELSSFAVRPGHVLALLSLRWKIGVRGFRRSVTAIIGLIALLVFIGGFGIGSGLLTGLGYLYLPRPAGAQLLFLALGLLYLAWVALPALQYTVNEGLDVSRLQTYPLTRAERMVGLTLATLFDPSTFIILSLFAAALVGWGASPLSITLDVVALALLYVHTVGLSQMALASLVGMLRSRRYRDLSVLIFALMSVICSLSGQFASTLLRNVHNLDLLGRIDVGRYAQWLPPGMAARVIILARAGDYVSALPWLAALALTLPLLLWVWAWTLDRGVTSPESGGSRRQATRRSRAAAVGASVGVALAATAPTSAPSIVTQRKLISPVVVAVAVKDLRYMWRDPQIKASLLSSLVLLFVVFAPGLIRDPHATRPDYFSQHLAGLQPLLAPLPALLIVLTLSINALGLERQGLQTLFQFPAKPLDILWGKNLAVGLVALTTQVVLIVAECAVTGFWFAAPLALAEGVAAMLTLLGTGNVTSVLLPLRVRSLNVGSNNLSSESGCLRSVISLFALWGTLAVLAPVFVLLLLPPLIARREWLVVSAPLAVLYGLAVYQVATRLIAPKLAKRGPDILAMTTRDA